MPEVRYHLTGQDLHTIANGIGLRPATSPGILATIADAARDEDLESAAGIVFKLVLATRPFGDDSVIFALEASRVFLYANGLRLGKADVARAEALVAAVEKGQLDDPAEIGKRLIALDR